MSTATRRQPGKAASSVAAAHDRARYPLVLLGVVISYAGIAAVTAFHVLLEQAQEAEEVPFLLHVLRDGTLALPVVLMTVFAAAQLMAGRSRPLAVVALGFALAGSLALALAAPAHELLFEAHDEGHDHPPLLHFALNLGYAFVGAAPAAFAVLLARRPRSAAAGPPCPEVNR